MLYELRHYTAMSGRSDALLDRFSRHTLPIFRSLGFEVADFWHEEKRREHIWYVLVWTDNEARHAGWAKFRADKTWKGIKARTEADGPLTESIESKLLTQPAFFVSRS